MNKLINNITYWLFMFLVAIFTYSIMWYLDKPQEFGSFVGDATNGFDNGSLGILMTNLGWLLFGWALSSLIIFTFRKFSSK